jgi:hypothetical protein
VSIAPPQAGRGINCRRLGAHYGLARGMVTRWARRERSSGRRWRLLSGPRSGRAVSYGASKVDQGGTSTGRQDMYESKDVQWRITEAKRVTARVVDHVHYLLNIHENNAVVPCRDDPPPADSG